MKAPAETQSATLDTYTMINASHPQSEAAEAEYLVILKGCGVSYQGDDRFEALKAFYYHARLGEDVAFTTKSDPASLL